MANNELAYRFTETNYLTKNEVSRELKMTLIDNIWSNILSYRSAFNTYLSLKSIYKASFVYCGCASTTNLSKAIEDKINRIYNDFFKNGFEVESYKNSALFNLLSEVGYKYNVSDKENLINNLLANSIKTITSSQACIANYYQALSVLGNSSYSEIDLDYVAKLYATLNNVSRVTSLYRKKEDESQENRVLIDRVYTAAPVASIEPMMDNFYSFINTSSLPLVSKTIIAYFFINYVKPFEEHNEEMAILIAKSVLAKYGNAECAYLINLEFLLNEQPDAQAKIFAEVQKTFDITYAVRFLGKMINRYLDDFADIVAKKHTLEIKKDLYQIDDDPKPVAKPVEEPVKVEPVTVPDPKPVIVEKEPVVLEENPVPSNHVVESVSLFDNFEEPVEPKAAAVEEPVIEEKKEISTPKPAVIKEAKPKVVKEPKVVTPKPRKQFPQVNTDEVAISSDRVAIHAPNDIDEREAYRLEKHLLEIEPEMKKGEARFYARHCTLGCRYTIQQYKKFNRCAYETARTSMDQLYELGYYKKEQIKNKFVYTPIEQ